MTTQTVKRCEYWSCTKPIHPDAHFCLEHYHMWRDGFLDQCPKCHRFKAKYYRYCQDCQLNLPVTTSGHSASHLEYSDAWVKEDKNANRFYAYILRLDKGDFYVGQTRELRERLAEHRNGKVLSTKGLNPILQYFEILPNRNEATIREAQLKHLRDNNPRQIERMIIQFQDLVREFHL